MIAHERLKFGVPEISYTSQSSYKRSQGVCLFSDTVYHVGTFRPVSFHTHGESQMSAQASNGLKSIFQLEDVINPE